ncbi:MAG: glycoside hydrolase family 2 [Sediminibacterium sp.]|nr:glycoside hydrolase family 2 [Sediminibacterium sp.]
MRSLLSLLFLFCCLLTNAQQTVIKYLSGTDKDHTVNWDFFCTEGAKSGSWTKIPVPSNWEMQGFGGYNYGHEKNKHQEHGLYKYHFTADKNWGSKQVELVFAGVMTDVEVKINGQVVGPLHQGGFYEFSYNITPFIKPGADNVLEADVSKMSADSSVNRAEREGDFWVFGGIYRPVYLKIQPENFINRVAIDAKADGKFNMDVWIENITPRDVIIAQIKTIKGENIGNSFSTVANNIELVHLSQSVPGIQAWNPEFPKLYKVEISILRKNKIIHTLQQRFGFRTIEVRKGDGIYVNNTKVILKGVNRHSSWPESGRTLSRKIHLQDIALIKDMNMNAVRMSHYPPDAEFLDLCDSLGLFVLDELTGWQKKYATPVGAKLVAELVKRDVNHPSIIFWDNGNEGGWNTDLDSYYAQYDPQYRTVLHPWSNFNNVDTKHYPDYAYIEKAAAKDDILLHTEMIHGLYDGGHGAGLEDYWNLMRKNPHHAGGFLWVLADEGIVRHDKHDSIDTYGNNAPDGIVGPHREKEGSYYTIKELWSPVQVSKPVLDKNFDGKLEIENNYHYTNLSVCKFTWQLIKYPLSKENKTGHSIITSGKSTMALEPGKKESMQLSLPANWYSADALCFSAIDVNGHELYTWTWPIKLPSDILHKNQFEDVVRQERIDPKEIEEENIYSILQDGIKYNFDKKTGLLQSIIKNNKIIPFGDGPVLANEKQSLQSFRHHKGERDSYVIEIAYSGINSLNLKWTFAFNFPAKLEYSYTQKDTSSFYGITFNTDESKITGLKWLGGGPFHVWKNRLKGATIDVWHKKYNNTITGETFEYPEFKGYHSDMYWATIENTVSPFTVYTDVPGLYLQMFNTPKQKTNFNPFVNPPFPKGNIGFLNGIPPIGTKFKGAETMGPKSQKNNPVDGLIKGSLWFDFR